MENDKDIRFTNKKVDESWKEQASREKEIVSAQATAHSKTSVPGESAPDKQSSIPTSKEFMNLLSSLGYQAMMHLGEIPDPGTGQKEVSLEAAKEIIDLLVVLQKKTTGHTSKEESAVFASILPELQMKFSQLA